jgi:hypothetical protein
MSKLTDTQLVILSTASQRADRHVLPLPERLKGGAAQKVVGALITRDLAAEVAARPGDPVWRETDEGQALTLVATDAALAALGVEPERAPDAADEAEPAPVALEAAKAPDAAPAPATAPGERKARAGTKQALLIDMLERPEGASIAEIVANTGWLPHTVRGAIAGALKKKLGLNVVSEKDEARGRVYKITH